MAGSETTSTGSTSGQSQGGETSTGAMLAQTGGEIQGQVAGIADQVRQQATDQLSSQKEKLVDTLDTVALLLRQAGEHAHLQEKSLLADYLDKASGQVSQITETLGAQDPEEIVTQVKQLAARQPLLFVGGALAVGFLGTRFLRSSAPAESTASTPAGGQTTGTSTSSSGTGSKMTSASSGGQTSERSGSGSSSGSGKQAGGRASAQSLGGASSRGASSASGGAAAGGLGDDLEIDEVIAIVDMDDASGAERQ
jgi:hypothetical protein